MITNRAWVLLPSGRRLDLLNPDSQAWTDHDLSLGLSRTYRWAGYSAWDLPLSLAQHSLTVLAIPQPSAGPGLTPPEALRELLDDAEEAVLGGWDPITPLKPHLGPGFHALVQRLQTAVAERYRLPAWTPRATPCTSMPTGSPPPARPSTSPVGAGRRYETVWASRSNHSRMIHCRRPRACIAQSGG